MKQTIVKPPITSQKRLTDTLEMRKYDLVTKEEAKSYRVPKIIYPKLDLNIAAISKSAVWLIFILISESRSFRK